MATPAVVLFSGGMDSTTCIAHAIKEGFAVHALTIHYGQKHNSEIEAAKKIAAAMNVAEHHIIILPFGTFGGSALTDDTINVADANQSSGIPSTYIPARNTIFLALALSFAETRNAHHIYIGASSVDYSNYPDCRPQFIREFERLANLGTKSGAEGTRFTIHAPLQYLTKAETILHGLSLGVDYSQTVSCYRADSEGRACGNCDCCYLRKKGYSEAGVRDDTRYIR